MYPVKLGLVEAKCRMNKLMENGHDAELLLTSVFTLEKTIKRILKHCIIRRGFKSDHADKIISKSGFNQLKELWPVFARSNENLCDSFGQNSQAVWQHIPEAVTMRNKLVHGEKVYDLSHCKSKASQVLIAIDALSKYSKTEFGFDGWSRIKSRRKPILTWD